MLKCYITVFLFFSFSCKSFTQIPNPSEIKNNKIKKITIRSGGQSKDGTHISEIYYNQNGNDTARYEGGERRSYKIITYNRSLQPLMITEFSPDGKEMEKTTFTYKLDESYTSVNTDTQFGLKITDKYDKKGHLLSHTIPDGTVIRYLYNTKGQLTGSYSIPIKGEKKISNQYTYNARGKLISTVNKSGFTSSSVYEYDARGLLKKVTTTAISISKEKFITTEEYEYSYYTNIRHFTEQDHNHADPRDGTLKPFLWLTKGPLTGHIFLKLQYRTASRWAYSGIFVPSMER